MGGISDILLVELLILALLLVFAYFGVDPSHIWSEKKTTNGFKTGEQQLQKLDLGEADPLWRSLARPPSR